MSIESGLPSRVLYTSVGKGGRYVRLGVSNGAGSSRGEVRVVYQDVENQHLFHRTEEDFASRMIPAPRDNLHVAAGSREKHTAGPLSIRIKEAWPFTIETVDAAGEVIFSDYLPCFSTRDASLDDALSGIHFDAHMRDECVQLNARAMANIRLRAIAPDLWEACEMLLAIPQLGDVACEPLQEALRNVRAVMARADEGRA